MLLVEVNTKLRTAVWPQSKAAAETTGALVRCTWVHPGAYWPTVPCLVHCYRPLLWAQDTSKDDQLVTFCTGVRSGDVLMPMWCGTDYDHELAMKCSTYFNM